MKTTEYEYWSPQPHVGYKNTEKIPQERKMYNKRYSGVSLFCESTSIRGMAKIAKSQTRFLKMLWLLFIVFMTGGLFASATLLVLDFLNYDVGVHTSNIKLSTEFPALTICHHHPFSKNAYKLWDTKTVMSPSLYNKRLRKMSQKELKANNPDEALMTLNYDSVEIYYQSLYPNEVIPLGHNYTAYINCMTVSRGVNTYESDCTKLKKYVVKRFSHRKFFNCYTFEPSTPERAQEIDIFSVVVKMGPSPNYTHFEQAFLFDVFEQARGLRIVVHERESLPDMDQEGIHVEPGKFTEVTYEPIIWEKLNTPRKPCQNTNRTFRDLGQEYRYSSKQCNGHYNQLTYNKECKCILALELRPNPPSENLPYCGNMFLTETMEMMSKRIECLGKFISKFQTQQRDKEPDENGALCLPRCTYVEFQNQISITEWRATSWQLYWMRTEYSLLNQLRTMKRSDPNNTLNVSSTQEYQKIAQYLDSVNLTHFRSNDKDDFFTHGKKFAYVRLKRKSQFAVIKREKLILSLNVLLSRVGGLCSLSIGLTTAFIVELIEFLYLYCRAESGYLNDTANHKSSNSGGQFISKTEETHDFAMYTCSSRPSIDLYGPNRNGRFGQSSRTRMYRADHNVPTGSSSSSKLKFRKDSAGSPCVG